MHKNVKENKSTMEQIRNYQQPDLRRDMEFKQVSSYVYM